MFNYNQWINWEPVYIPGEVKPRKRPVNGIDAHNPNNWLSYDQARLISENVGFVLTENDPYFFVDIDNGLQVDGTWLPHVYDIVAMFPGAFIETSFSGRGLHIIAQGTIPDGYKKKNTALGLELYDRKRYVAITCWYAQGSPDVNHQTALNQFAARYIELDTVTNSTSWGNQPRHDWVGPTDDDELIRRMLEARPSANALWGNAATIKELWENNIQVFVDKYPDGKGWYDGSSVDMALASHLAFWTGCNHDRMERLMRRSGLNRPKWDEHPTYLKQFTITKAVDSCQNVYKDPKAASEQIISNKPEKNNTGSTVRVGLQYLTVDAQLKYFEGCVYIIKTHRVLLPNGEIINPEQFKVVYGGYEFAMDDQNLKTTKCAWEAFTRSRAITFPMVNNVLFRPELAAGEIINKNGLTYVNSYVPYPVDAIEGDVTPFLDLMAKHFPDERDRLIMLCYLAALVQYKGKKFQWCPLIQGVEGNGKTFYSEVIFNAIGDRHCHTPNPSDIANKFNHWIEGKCFAAVEELYISDRRHVIDAMKIIITNRRIEIQPKGGNQYMGDNRVNLITNTNYKDAVIKTRNDRRYAPLHTPQQNFEDLHKWGMDGDYFPDLYDWAENGGYQHITYYLMNYRIPDQYNPATKCHRAPWTTATANAIEATKDPVVQEIENAIEEGLPGFCGGWVSSLAVDKLLKEMGKDKVIHRNKRSEIIMGMGYQKLGRSSMVIGIEGNKRPILYLKDGRNAGADWVFEYMTAQGYINLGG